MVALDETGQTTTLLSETLKMDGSIASAFTCPVCLGFYKDPVMLNCGHALCLSCEKNIHTAVGKNKCPECRVEYTATKEMNAIVSVRKALAALPNEDVAFSVGETCIHVGNYTEAAKSCPHCDMPFCAACMVCHLERVRIEMKWIYDSFEQRQAVTRNCLEDAVQKAKNTIASSLNDARSRVRHEAEERIKEIRQKESECLSKLDSHEKQETASLDWYLETKSRIPADIKVLGDKLHAISGTSLLFHSAEQIHDLHREIIDLDHKIYAQEYLQWHASHFKFEVDEQIWKNFENQQLEIGHSTNMFPGINSKKSTEPLRLQHAVVEAGLEEVKEFYERPQSVPLPALRQIVDTESMAGDDVAVVVAAKEGRTDIVRYLVENCGADVLRKDGTEIGDMAVHAAARCDHVDTVEYLVQREKTSVSARNNKKLHAFQVAVGYGSFGVAKYLLETGLVNVEERDSTGFTLLMTAVAIDDVEAAKYLIEDAFADAMVVDPDNGNNLIHIAVWQNSTNALEYLVTKFPELTTRDDSEGASPIFDACLCGSLECFVILAEADHEYVTKMGNLLLHNAAIGGNVDLGQLLIEKYGAAVDMINKGSGKAAIHCAIAQNKPDFVALLLKANPALKNLACRKAPFETPRQMANRLGFEEIKKLLQDGL